MSHKSYRNKDLIPLLSTFDLNLNTNAPNQGAYGIILPTQLANNINSVVDLYLRLNQYAMWDKSNDNPRLNDDLSTYVDKYLYTTSPLPFFFLPCLYPNSYTWSLNLSVGYPVIVAFEMTSYSLTGGEINVTILNINNVEIYNQDFNVTEGFEVGEVFGLFTLLEVDTKQTPTFVILITPSQDNTFVGFIKFYYNV